ncbi:hypothetical protein V1524DRAFT_63435 [Lipomyces starkeyi]
MWSPKRWLSPRHRTEELAGERNTGPTTPIRQRSLWSNVLSFFSSPINPRQRRNPESEASDTPWPESDSEDDVSSSSGSLWEPASPLRKPRRMRSIPVSSTRQQEENKGCVESPPELTDLSKNQWQPDARAPQRRVDRRHRRRIRRRPAVHVEQPPVGRDPLPGAVELERRLILDRQVAIRQNSALVAARQDNSRRGRQLTVDLDEIVEEGQLAVEDFSAQRLQNLMAHEEHRTRMNAPLGLANRQLTELRLAEMDILTRRYPIDNIVVRARARGTTETDYRYPSCLRDMLEFDKRLKDVRQKEWNVKCELERNMKDVQLQYQRELDRWAVSDANDDPRQAVAVPQRRLIRRPARSASRSTSANVSSTDDEQVDSLLSDTDSDSDTTLPELADIFAAERQRRQAQINADRSESGSDINSVSSTSSGSKSDDVAEAMPDQLEHYEFLEWLFRSGFACDHHTTGHMP